MNAPALRSAVILAGGMGTRMRQPRPEVMLEPAQAAMADLGLKTMIPIAGRPFLDYVLTAIADAGYRDVCVVVGRDHQVLRDYYTGEGQPTRLRLKFTMQGAPTGTAHALAAAEEFVGRDQFLMVNADNYYPSSVLAALRSLGEAGFSAFEPESLVKGGDIVTERLQEYAVAFVDGDGYLKRIVEKPSVETLTSDARHAFISMNCWRFSPEIFQDCRAIAVSARREFELAAAVQHAIDVLHERFRAVPSRQAVLDLSNRSDIARVTAKLQHIAVLT
jgi:glucose-1-phosphate thymidylyltransferase